MLNKIKDLQSVTINNIASVLSKFKFKESRLSNDDFMIFVNLYSTLVIYVSCGLAKVYNTADHTKTVHVFMVKK